MEPMNKGRLIVLSGEAGAGKDSVANILVEKYGYEKFSLSEEMKVFCGRVFGFSEEQLRGPSRFRNEPDPRWARPCPSCNGTGSDCASYPIQGCKHCDGDGKINDNSPRRILQLLGDEWSRQMIHPDIWTMSVRPVLEAKLVVGAKIVINDARFENDRNNLHDWLGAKRIDIRTPGKVKKDDAAWRKHASELSRPKDENVEFIIYNHEGWPLPAMGDIVSSVLDELFDE